MFINITESIDQIKNIIILTAVKLNLLNYNCSMFKYIQKYLLHWLQSSSIQLHVHQLLAPNLE